MTTSLVSKKRVPKEIDVKYSRQSSCIPNTLYNKKVCIIGCGAVGRNIAVQLTAMGVGSLALFDFDKVEDHNIVSQGFLLSDIGTFKVDALKSYCSNLNKDTEVIAHNTVWRPDDVHYDYVFMCADCMTVRANVSRYYNNRRRKSIFIDTRMRGEDLRILSCFDRSSRRYYKNNGLFTNDQALDGGCTSITTIYCAVHTASSAIQNMVNHLNKRTVHKDIVQNLANGLLIRT